MSDSGHHDTGDETEQQSSRSEDDTPLGDGVAGWFAVSTLRVGLAIVGFVLLLFALGQVAGFDLIGLVVDAISTPVGRWVVVAVFALLIIVVAARGFGSRTE